MQLFEGVEPGEAETCLHSLCPLPSAHVPAGPSFPKFAKERELLEQGKGSHREFETNSRPCWEMAEGICLQDLGGRDFVVGLQERPNVGQLPTNGAANGPWRV